METQILSTWLLWDKFEELWYRFEELSWAITPKVMKYPDWSKQLRFIQDQWLNQKTWYYCTCYGTSQATDMLQWEVKKEFREWEQLWDLAVSKKLLDPKVWAYGIDIIKLTKSIWMIDGFLQVVNTASEMEKALENWPLVGWSNKINWKLTKDLAIYGEAYWHFFSIVQAIPTKKLFKCLNNYGTRKNDKGYFYIKYEDVERMLFRGLWVLMIDTDLLTLPLIESSLKERRKNKEDLYPLYLEQKTKFQKWEITQKQFNIFQIAYRRAYGLKRLADEIKI